MHPGVTPPPAAPHIIDVHSPNCFVPAPIAPLMAVLSGYRNPDNEPAVVNQSLQDGNVHVVEQGAGNATFQNRLNSVDAIFFKLIDLLPGLFSRVRHS